MNILISGANILLIFLVGWAAFIFGGAVGLHGKGDAFKSILIFGSAMMYVLGRYNHWTSSRDFRIGWALLQGSMLLNHFFNPAATHSVTFNALFTLIAFPALSCWSGTGGIAKREKAERDKLSR